MVSLVAITITQLFPMSNAKGAIDFDFGVGLLDLGNLPSIADQNPLSQEIEVLPDLPTAASAGELGFPAVPDVVAVLWVRLYLFISVSGWIGFFIVYSTLHSQGADWLGAVRHGTPVLSFPMALG